MYIINKCAHERRIQLCLFILSWQGRHLELTVIYQTIYDYSL